MISACFLLWCLGQSIAPADRASFASDVRHTDRTEQICPTRCPGWSPGLSRNRRRRCGVWRRPPELNIRLLGDRLMFTGGAVLASDTVPAAGTHANFMARLQLELTDRFALTYWHWSNAHLGRHNPSVDSIGVTMRLRSR